MSRIAYVNGEYLSLQEATVSVEDRGFQFGDGIYEVIKLYQGHLFKLDKHLDRLLASAKLIDLDIGYSRKELEEISKEVLRRNSDNKESSLYIQITRGVTSRSHSYSDDLTPTMIMYLLPAKSLSSELRDKGVRVITLPDNRWRYCNIKTINLLPNILAKKEAEERGAFEGIFVNDDKIITEGTSSNLFIYKDGVIKTHPLGAGILGGITRDVVLELIRDNFKFKEERFTLLNLYNADEVFITSTTKEVLGVVQVDDQKIGDGKVGPITKELYSRYKQYIGNRDNF